MMEELFNIYNTTGDEETKKHALMLIEQANTAGGKEILRNEIEIFIENNLSK